MVHLRNSNWLHPQIEGTGRRRFGIHLSATVATTFAVLAIGASLVSSSMTLVASAAAVRSPDLSPHGAFVPNTPDSVVGIAPTSDDLGYRTITANSFVSGYGD